MLRVRIPATSANIGPGFDCVGMAVNLWNTFELYYEPAASGVLVENHGEGEGILPVDQSHLTAQTMIAELLTLGKLQPASRFSGWRIVCNNQVPCASGLGSSSTAVLAGLIFAYALSEKLDMQHVLTRAALIEGHADNVAPAVLGGLVFTGIRGTTLLTQMVSVPVMQIVVCVPDFNFLTVEARALLPKSVAREDSIFNTSRSLLIVEALRSGNDELLRSAMDDRLHEPFRFQHIPGILAAKETALSQGALAVCLSGAGPGLLAFARENHSQIGTAMQTAFEQAGLSSRFWILDAFTPGLRIETI